MKIILKKVHVTTKIFYCRLSKQFVNQITLLCDGKCHHNAAKTVLWQLIVVYILKSSVELCELFVIHLLQKLQPSPSGCYPVKIFTDHYVVRGKVMFSQVSVHQVGRDPSSLPGQVGRGSDPPSLGQSSRWETPPPTPTPKDQVGRTTQGRSVSTPFLRSTDRKDQRKD